MFVVTKNGKPLQKHLCVFDRRLKTFASNEDGLRIECDSDWVLRTGAHCTFKTGSGCTFSTGPNCSFEVENNCAILYFNCATLNIESYLPAAGHYRVERGSIYEVKEEPKKEMTVAEIEKALGYSIKIVKEI